VGVVDDYVEGQENHDDDDDDAEGRSRRPCPREGRELLPLASGDTSFPSLRGAGGHVIFHLIPHPPRN